MADYTGVVNMYPQPGDPEDISERIRMNQMGQVYLDHNGNPVGQTGPRRDPRLYTPGMGGTQVQPLPADPKQARPKPPPKKTYEQLKAEADALSQQIKNQTQGVDKTPTAVRVDKDIPDWLEAYAKENGLM
jgi:hypothetical protein